MLSERSSVPKETKDTWDKLFKEQYGSDVYIITEDKSYIQAHSSVLVSYWTLFFLLFKFE